MKTEFEFIESIRQKSKIKNPKSKVKIGIGDDCAVISQDSKTDLVLTTDLLVEDIDFRLDWTTPKFLGQKALAVSLSDIAAMGAKPTWAMLSIGVPQKIWETDFIDEFYEGWFLTAGWYDTQLIGGDVSKTPDKIVIDSIVAGEVESGSAILRSGAKAGDLIFVTGNLGAAAAGLKLLESGVRYKTSDNKFNELMRRQLSPLPQLRIAELLNKKKIASAMIDLSDGLSSDLAHLCEASAVGATIDFSKIPINEDLSLLVNFESEIFDFVINGGEDFELLFTVNRKDILKLKRNLRNTISHIGEITNNIGKIELVTNAGVTELEPKGFQHF